MSMQGGPKIRIQDLDIRFSNEIQKRAGTDFRACLQCRSCSGGHRRSSDSAAPYPARRQKSVEKEQENGRDKEYLKL